MHEISILLFKFNTLEMFFFSNSRMTHEIDLLIVLKASHSVIVDSVQKNADHGFPGKTTIYEATKSLLTYERTFLLFQLHFGKKSYEK